MSVTRKWDLHSYLKRGQSGLIFTLNCPSSRASLRTTVPPNVTFIIWQNETWSIKGGLYYIAGFLGVWYSMQTVWLHHKYKIFKYYKQMSAHWKSSLHFLSTKTKFGEKLKKIDFMTDSVILHTFSYALECHVENIHLKAITDAQNRKANIEDLWIIYRSISIVHWARTSWNYYGPARK